MLTVFKHNFKASIGGVMLDYFSAQAELRSPDISSTTATLQDQVTSSPLAEKGAGDGSYQTFHIYPLYVNAASMYVHNNTLHQILAILSYKDCIVNVFMCGKRSGKNEYFPADTSDTISPAMKNFSFTLSGSSPAVQQSSNSTSPVFSLAHFGASSAVGMILSQ